MLGYECDQCGGLVTQSEPRERRDCPHCGSPADQNRPTHHTKDTTDDA